MRSLRPSHRRVTLGLVVLVASSVLAGASLRADEVPNPAGCASDQPGGEWREYSHDLANTRHQPLEDVIGPDEAAALQQVWRFDVASQGGGGVYNHDPIVADGCVYLGSSGGLVAALNADDGSVVWTRQLEGTVNSSPTVRHGKVYVHLSVRQLPQLVVLDQATSEILHHVVLDDQMEGTELISSPKVFGAGNLVFSGISGAGAEAGTTFTGNPQSRLHFRGIFTITDLSADPPVVTKGYTIPDDDFAAGYSGGGIWSSPAVDEEAGYAYVGSGNPFSPHEHNNTNAILKVGVDPGRADFGQIAGVYHGTNDQYVDDVTYKPQCDAYVDVFTCETSDFDFGASPQLFTGPDGEGWVGAHQKSGVYHTAARHDMSGVWKQTVGGPFGWFGGEGTASFDGQGLVVPGNVPGVMNMLDKDTGVHDWVTPIADGIHFTSVTTANGVAYVVDTRGVLDIYDTATGLQIAAKHMGVEAASPTTTGFSTGHSVTVARHTVFVPYGGTVIAYQPAAS